MQNLFTKIEQDFNCTIGVYAKNINGQKKICFHENEIFPAASIIKLFIAGAIMYEIKNKNKNLSRKIKIKEGDKIFGNSIIADLNLSYYSIRDLLYFLLTHSDNSAQNILEKKVISKNEVDNFLKNFNFSKSKYISLKNSDIKKKSLTTPKEATKMLEGIQKLKYFDRTLTHLILKFLNKTRDTHFGLRYLPCKLNVKNPEIINFYSKVGKLENTVNNCLLLETKKDIFIISVFVKNIKIKKFRNNVDNQGAKLLGMITRNIFDYLR